MIPWPGGLPDGDDDPLLAPLRILVGEPELVTARPSRHQRPLNARRSWRATPHDDG